NHYLQLPKELQDASFINDIKGQLKTAVGMPVPNILWTENSSQEDLYSLTDANYYVVAFWSSTCSHCLIEMPVLYDLLKDSSQIKVISLGLEDDTSKSGWETQISNYPNFINIYGENKWQNQYARDYGVNATPSFFVLDKNKKVIAKPDDVEELKAFFSEKYPQ
ncbi:MAG: thioredoxin family protein, partial [Aureibaculum sp.]|nr:thioredoxin family protein [Aureibaculum sp.]